MITWTTSARAVLDHHNQAVRQQLHGSGADAEEVAADLRRHVDEELIAAKIHVATEDAVKRILARMGVSVTEAVISKPQPKSIRRKVLLLGMALVAAAVVLLLCLRFRANNSGPFPNAVHYELGQANFLPGDAITIRQLRGTSSTISVGHTYCVEGTYNLASQDAAILAFFSTIAGPGGTGPNDPQ